MEHPEAAGWLGAVEASGLGRTMRDSLWLYPAVETLHIIGFALLVGGVAVFDVGTLRARALEGIDALAAWALPIAKLGFALALPCGLLLFVTEATAYIRNPAFLAKQSLLALALGNVLWFHLRRKRMRAGDGLAGLKGIAALSLGLWLGVLTCGRLIAYL